MTKAIDIMTGLNNNAEFVSIRQEKESDKRGCCKIHELSQSPLLQC